MTNNLRTAMVDFQNALKKADQYSKIDNNIKTMQVCTPSYIEASRNKMSNAYISVKSIYNAGR